MDVITPNKLLYRDFNSYAYGTEIMNFLLMNKQEIDPSTHEFSFCMVDVQTTFKKNMNYNRFYQTVLELKNDNVQIDNSTFSIFSRVDDPINGQITVEIHPSVIGYFGKLHSDFTRYHLYSLICLSSPMSKKLYLLLSHFRRVSNVVNEQESFCRKNIDQLRSYLFIDKQYRGFHNFHKFLTKHIEEINKVTDFYCTITPEKKGKKYNSYNFYIKQNPIVKDFINNCFKEDKEIPETIALVADMKRNTNTDPTRVQVTYYLSSFELHALREKLVRVPNLKTIKADQIIEKVKVHGFSTMKNFERWLILLEDIIQRRKQDKIPNPAGYVIQSLLKNNG